MNEWNHSHEAHDGSNRIVPEFELHGLMNSGKPDQVGDDENEVKHLLEDDRRFIPFVYLIVVPIVIKGIHYVHAHHDKADNHSHKE
ncbi:hypothetical protein D1872_299940 [compost metagenome]